MSPATIVEAAREDATADLQTMVGASREERALSSVSFAIKKRLPWLQVNLGTAFLAAAVIALVTVVPGARNADEMRATLIDAASAECADALENLCHPSS